MDSTRASSWQIRGGIDKALTMALYVRDAAGLDRYASYEPDLPPLQPPVQLREVDGDLAAVIRQWEQWWTRALAQSSGEAAPPYPPSFAGLEDLPAVRALLEAHFEGAREWMRSPERLEEQRAQTGSIHLTHFVNAYRSTLGRAVRPFTLTVREVPVEGRGGWVLGPDVVVVSTSLADDEEAMEAFLRPVVDALV